MSMRGFTLTELLVAVALMSTVAAGGLASLARARSAWQHAGVEARLHERAQYVLATLEPELQLAGYFGPAGPPLRLAAATIPTPALSCGLDLMRRVDVPVEKQDFFNLACAAQGSGAQPGSEVLVVRRASVGIAAVQPGRAQWRADALGRAAGELSWDGHGSVAQPAAPEIRNFLLRVFYVARAADGDASTPALRMKNLSSIAGTPAFIDTEVMPGVEALHVELLPATGQPHSARVTLQVRADQADQKGGQPPRRLTVSRLFVLRNASL
jgi:prepilin-type N-terminal cleavage/methylation domain-containing protein